LDAVVLTKDSERVLEKCLTSIFENVPLNHLIIVDGYSTDSTLEIIERFQKEHGNVVLIRDDGTRGSARLKGIKKVETDWFLFVDSDVTLCNKWYDKAKSFIRDDVGAVWGTEIWQGIQNPRVMKLFLRTTRKIFEIRGGTHDLLVRLDAVRDIDIPRDLHVFEDTYIKEWVARKGYKLIPTYDPYCIHHRPEFVWTVKGSCDVFIDSMKHIPFQKIPKLFLAYAFYTAYVAYRTVFTRMKD
jgi:glycosyltransferase involved in cell wall biosynthesis